ncbi:amino acid permease [Williamsia sp. CHRR-6]|uniref:amino acid permease n=1 Tax=Williamsia sp. CHRR-6 TaxID=2835871 RepID=UPI001BD9C418|nr:amino acid permease [Williamsia sp. CHRR-6]MBT0566506.1 amino acid permease [Williamsia sp. CHRR-6]
MPARHQEVGVSPKSSDATGTPSERRAEIELERNVPETLGYAFKRLFLGKPMISDQLKNERLSNPVAMGVLAPDAISSTAYGTELILVELLPYAGLAAFSLLLPITGVILVILVLVAASYRQVVMTYTRAGGSYVVARDNFGPRVAQIAAAALLIDYVVTVAVQASAGTVAVVSAIRPLGPYSLEITIGVVVIMAWVNLRGLREAGRPFAIPTYFFTAMVLALIVVGVIRDLLGNLTMFDPGSMAGTVEVHQGDGLIAGASLLIILRAFANGGSSLTGVEAISNTVGTFRKPEGPNARLVLTIMACVLGILLTGVAWLAYRTHALPYTDGYPSLLSEIAKKVFGDSIIGHLLYYALQIATAAILFTGANTSFNGFPALANFVAADRFLPRQLSRRGHRLVFSNGIMVLAVSSILLLLFTGGSVNALVPFYAIGVFTGFAMAGYGMTKHHLTHRETRWRGKLVINLSAGIVSTVVVGIFAIAKFTEGAWLVVVVFPLLVTVLIRLNREYSAEAAILDNFRTNRPERVNYAQHDAIILVNSLDLAVLEAVRYGVGLRADRLVAIHLMTDEAQARTLQHRWDHFGLTVPLKIVDCPDRRITRGVQRLVVEALESTARSHVTVLLPRRTYAPFLGRLLHDRTADKIARAVSAIPHAAATIVPFDVQAQIRKAFPDMAEERLARKVERLQSRIVNPEAPDSLDTDSTPPAVLAIDGLMSGYLSSVEGRVTEISEDTYHDVAILVVEVADDSGALALRFTPRKAASNAQLRAGQLVRAVGKARQARGGEMIMVDPDVEVVTDDSADTD